MRTGFILTLTLCGLLTHNVSAQTWTWSWARKVGFAGLADPFCAHPQNPATIFGSAGNNIMMVSRDRGRTWTPHAVLTGGNQIKAVAVSGQDTMLMLAAQEGDTEDRILRSTDHGATWTVTLTGIFYYFGHPLAYEPEHVNGVVYTMASNVIRRSTDFGLTWDSVSSSGSFGSGNGGWEDAFIRPDSAEILFVADNATGIWKSADAGSTWLHVHTATGEVPALAVNPLNPAVAYASRWGGGGGFLRTTNFGTTWEPVPQFAGLNTWGVDVAPDHPEVVAFGTWGPVSANGGGIHISRDGGSTWQHTYTGIASLNNHAVFLPDTTNILSLWGDGIWKLRRPGRIAGSVFADLNADGTQDSTEPLLAGWKVRLEGTQTDSTLTGPAGEYRFDLLAHGNHSARVVPPAGWSVSLPAGGLYGPFTVSDGEVYDNRDFGVTAATVATGAVEEGWNMVSVSLHPPDPLRTAVFPSAVSRAFAYGAAGYTAADTLLTGVGYWLKFASDQIVAVAGGAVTVDTIAVTPGWNLLGTIGATVAVDSVEQSPPGILVSPFFGFAGGSYTVAASLEPLRSYWVKASHPGVIILRGGVRPPSP